ncbi:MAG: ATP-binding cassette domain-containing protein [Rickettsiales bacterium]
MSHKPLSLSNLSLEFPHKICFKNFNCVINYGDHIAIIGINGGGKSSLLKILLQEIEQISSNITIGYIPQIIDDSLHLSGGQRFNQALTKVLALNPDILILDEPTNHLDIKNKAALLKMLNKFRGTLVVASHDLELLRSVTNIFWHIDNAKVNIFLGNYDNYVNQINSTLCNLEGELSRLSRQKKDIHHSLMQEQNRAAKSKQQGQKSMDNKKWPTVTSKTKALNAQESSGKKKIIIAQKKENLTEKLKELRLPEVISPKFRFNWEISANKTLVSIKNASIGYTKIILKDINLELFSHSRVAILGDNGSGKSTLIKAILDDKAVSRYGDWYSTKDVGYLDQHYSNLDQESSVLEIISQLVPSWNMEEIRNHLNDFLFHKTQEVNTKVKQLSGGEKVRLSLAKISANAPKLLILDEITNNLDLQARRHVIEVLKKYPGAMIVISHDYNFLQEIEIEDFYEIKEGNLLLRL